MQKLVYAIAFVMAIIAPPQPLGICESWKRVEICSVSRKEAGPQSITAPRRRCVRVIQLAL